MHRDGLNAASSCLRNGKTDSWPTILNKSCKDWGLSNGKYLGLHHDHSLSVQKKKKGRTLVLGLWVHRSIKKQGGARGGKRSKMPVFYPTNCPANVFVPTQLGFV